MSPVQLVCLVAKMVEDGFLQRVILIIHYIYCVQAFSRSVAILFDGLNLITPFEDQTCFHFARIRNPVKFKVPSCVFEILFHLVLSVHGVLWGNER